MIRSPMHDLSIRSSKSTSKAISKPPLFVTYPQSNTNFPNLPAQSDFSVSHKGGTHAKTCPFRFTNSETFKRLVDYINRADQKNLSRVARSHCAGGIP